MFHVVQRGQVLAAARFSNASPVSRKRLPGEIVHLEIAVGALSPQVRSATLQGPGEAWQIEILAIASLPVSLRGPLPPCDGVMIRLLNRLAVQATGPVTVRPQIEGGDRFQASRLQLGAA